MMNKILNVREMKEKDVKYWLNYWLNSPAEHLVKMGIDLNKKPTRQQLIDSISDQLEGSYSHRKAYYLIWMYEDIAIGHTNINKIKYGNQAFMHLHLWYNNYRKSGLGAELIKKSLPFYFKNFKLKTLYCEPYALNPAPNKTLERLGFNLVKTYKTIPGASNFEQLVKQWKLTKESFVSLSL